MKKLKVTYYKNPESVGYICSACFENKVIFLGTDGNFTKQFIV